MVEITTAHTADVGPDVLAAARALLFDVFAPDMTEDDWEHALGGIHALAWEDGELVGHASVVARRMPHGGQALRTGYVEGVGVRADRRGRGYGGALMDRIERVIRGAYELGALGSTDEAVPFYTRRGWTRWRGPSSALTPDGVRRTAAEDGWIFVLPLARRLDLDGPLTCDWRDGDAW